MWMFFIACSFGPSEEIELTTGGGTHGKLVTSTTEARTLPPRPSPDGAPRASLDRNQCQDMLKEDGGPVTGPDCLSGTISCGEKIVGNTEGGASRFSTRFYEKHHCTVATTNHDEASERVYELILPNESTRAKVWLESPCVDLDLAAIKWDGETCPTEDSTVHQCEMWPKPRAGWEKVELVSTETTRWLVVVEGKKANGPFALHVECENRL